MEVWVGELVAKNAQLFWREARNSIQHFINNNPTDGLDSRLDLFCRLFDRPFLRRPFRYLLLRRRRRKLRNCTILFGRRVEIHLRTCAVAVPIHLRFVPVTTSRRAWFRALLRVRRVFDHGHDDWLLGLPLELSDIRRRRFNLIVDI